jgi:hypothetical protein
LASPRSNDAGEMAEAGEAFIENNGSNGVYTFRSGFDDVWNV